MWQLADAILSTVSLYTLCAVGLDRWMNIERPLRVFTRSRGRAKKAIALTWLLPVMIWLSSFFALRITTCRSQFANRRVHERLLDARDGLMIISILTFYIPCVLLVVLFVRIGVIVRKHFAFVHSNTGATPQQSTFRTNASKASLMMMQMQTQSCNDSGAI